MRARTLILLLTAFLSSVASLPASAYAAAPVIGVKVGQTLAIPGAPYGTYQTAFKPGDAVQLTVLSFSANLSLSVDASAVDVSTTTVDAVQGPFFDTLNGIISSSIYEYPVESFVIGTTTDGQKQIQVSAADSQGNATTTSFGITIDSQAPALSLTNISFSVTQPHEGDYFYLSGALNGTGSAAYIRQFIETALDANGNTFAAGDGCNGPIGYDYGPLNASIASSTTGTFSNVPVQIFECGNVGTLVAQAASLRITISAYDKAGNATSTSLSVPIPKNPRVSNVLFLPGTEASRLYMREPDGGERQLWEPSFHTDIPLLAMNPDGTSVNQIYTKDIIDSIYGNSLLVPGGAPHIDPGDLEVYGDFEHFMDGLVASSTLGLKAWAAYPYDWRYDVRDIINNGTLTEMPNGSLQTVYLENVLSQLASTSPTGKVTIVGHSTGGLLAKALMEKLATEGKTSLVDKVVLVSTPQWGTPTDVGAMLHGDGQGHLLGIIAYAPDVRAAAATMPGPYDLLPSPAYFSHIADPVATFAADDLAGPFNTKFPNGIASFTDLISFITDAFTLDSGVSSTTSRNTPLALSATLAAKAEATHAALDSWTPPSGVTVTSIAGWGQLTTYSYVYSSVPNHTVCSDGLALCSRENVLVHTALKTEDGDDTVVSPSAAGNVGQVWYFNAQKFGIDGKGKFGHQEITSAAPVQNSILNLLEGKSIDQGYMASTSPTAAKNPLTRIGGMSPINILATDAGGDETGIVPVPGTDGIYIAKHDIPGSAVDVSGEEKFIYLPQGAPYSVSVTGYDTGPANIQVAELDANSSVTQTTTVADIPVTPNTTGTFTFAGDNSLSDITVNNVGGSVNTIITPQTGTLVKYEPPAAPVPTTVPSAVPAPVGGISIPAVPLLPRLASTTSQVATTTQSSAPMTAKEQVAIKTPLKVSSAPKRTASSSATSTINLSQTASVYAALSQPQSLSTAGAVYHLLHNSWHALLHTLARIL